MGRTLRSTMAAVMMLGSAVPAVASAQVTVGIASPATGNCYPIGCAEGVTEYQQVYSSSLFSNPLDIGSITFFHTIFEAGSGQYAAGTYTFSLGTTTAAVNGLSANLASNITSPLSFFTTLIIAAGTSSAAPTFTIVGTNPFLYNPAAGNLLMDVTFTNTLAAQFDTYSDADASGLHGTSRAFVLNGAGLADNNGLVTRFDPAVTTTPEPATLTLFASGFAMVGLVVRRRRAQA